LGPSVPFSSLTLNHHITETKTGHGVCDPKIKYNNLISLSFHQASKVSTPQCKICDHIGWSGEWEKVTSSNNSRRGSACGSCYMPHKSSLKQSLIHQPIRLCGIILYPTDFIMYSISECLIIRHPPFQLKRLRSVRLSRELQLFLYITHFCPFLLFNTFIIFFGVPSLILF